MGVSKWHVKALVQKTISFLPFHESVNYYFQKKITKAVVLDDVHFGYKIGHASDHIAYYKKHGNPDKDCSIIELGTGWFPIIPLMMYLTKTGKVVSLDIQSWLSKKNQIEAISKIIEWRGNGKLDGLFDLIDESRWLKIVEIKENPYDFTEEKINEIIGFKPLLIDARNSNLEDKSVDFICSNNTFEHIYKEVLMGILREFKRIIKPEGVMSHFIDMSDHFAHSDPSITIYNFLKYSEKQWRLIDNKIQPQNRMRFEGFKNMYNALNIPVTELSFRKGDLSALESVKVHKEISSQFSTEEIAVSHGYIVSVMD